jgi:hypothetical protein
MKTIESRGLSAGLRRCSPVGRRGARLVVFGLLGAVVAATGACGASRHGVGVRSPQGKQGAADPGRGAEGAGPASRGGSAFVLIGKDGLFFNQEELIDLYSRLWDSPTLAPLEDELRAFSSKVAARHPGQEGSGRAMLCVRARTETDRIRTGLSTCYSTGFKKVTLGLVKERVSASTADKAIRPQDCRPLKLPSGAAPTGSRRLEILLSEDGYTLSWETGRVDLPGERYVIPLEDKKYNLQKLRALMVQWNKTDWNTTIVMEDSIPFKEVVAVLDLCRAMKYRWVELSAMAFGGKRVYLPYRVPDAPKSATSSDAPASPGSGPGPRRIQVEFRKVVLRGNLQHGVASRILLQSRGELERCYTEQWKVNPELARELKIRFTVAATGQVVAAKLLPSTVKDRKMTGCVTGAIRKLLFPKPDGGGIAFVTVLLSFQ